MTPAELRKYKGLEHVSDEQAVVIIASLKRLSLILLGASTKTDNGSTGLQEILQAGK